MRSTLFIAVVLAACTSRTEQPIRQDADAVADTNMADASVDSVSADGPTVIPSACAIPASALHAWTLDIPVSSAFAIQSDIVYAVDKRSQLLSTSYTRVAYCLQLDATFMYVELDDFTKGDIADTGIPTEAIFEANVTNLTVRTNAPGINNATNASGGAIELWPDCYDEGADAVYDTNDAPALATDCYGSFQVHRNTTTLFAYNDWAGGSVDPDDLGIGNQGQGNPDWTFATNADAYTVRKLQAFVIP